MEVLLLQGPAERLDQILFSLPLHLLVEALEERLLVETVGLVVVGVPVLREVVVTRPL